MDDVPASIQIVCAFVSCGAIFNCAWWWAKDKYEGKLKKLLIEDGYAEYRMDPKTGEKKFVRKSDGTEIK